MNNGHEPCPFTLPPSAFGPRWVVDIDTTTSVVAAADALEVEAGDKIEVAPRSLVLLRRMTDADLA